MGSRYAGWLPRVSISACIPRKNPRPRPSGHTLCLGSSASTECEPGTPARPAHAVGRDDVGSRKPWRARTHGCTRLTVVAMSTFRW
jgi:hypothetical protein